MLPAWSKYTETSKMLEISLKPIPHYRHFLFFFFRFLFDPPFAANFSSFTAIFLGTNGL
jgi:hypothetical protein